MPARFAFGLPLLAVLALASTDFAAPASAQLLKQLRDDVRGENPPDTPSTDPPGEVQKKAEEEIRRRDEERRERIRSWQRHWTHDQCRPEIQAEFAWTTTSQDDRSRPVSLPPIDQVMPPNIVNPYPSVADDFQPVAAEPLQERLHENTWLRTTLDVVTYEGNIDQYGTRFLAGQPGWVFLDIEVNWLVENFDGASDGSAIGDINAILLDLRSPCAEFRAGLGANWLYDVSTDLGFNVTSELEVSLKPFSARLGVDWGTLGQADFLHARATGGVEFGRIEIAAGYDFRAIGSVHFGGPVVAVTPAF